MGIRIKNLHNYIVTLKYPSTLTATTSKDCSVVPFPCKISNIVASLGSAGTGATATIADVHLNGTTIFGASTKITLAATTGTATYSALSSQPTNLAAGDVLTLDIDQIATAPLNLNVLITLTRTGMGAETNLADQDTIM